MLSILLPLPLLFLTATAFPAPTLPSPLNPPTVRVQFANDFTGANANALIPLTNTRIPLSQAYANTPLQTNQALLVTSFTFTANFQNVACTVFNGDKAMATISDPAKDYNMFSSTPVNWGTGFEIACSLSHSPSPSSSSPPTTTTQDQNTRTSEPTKVKVQISNDNTGRNGNADISLSNATQKITDLYKNTGLDVNGTFEATSLMFVGKFQNVDCKLLDQAGNLLAEIQDPKRDFERFAGMQAIDLGRGAGISCLFA